VDYIARHSHIQVTPNWEYAGLARNHRIHIEIRSLYIELPSVCVQLIEIRDIHFHYVTPLLCCDREQYSEKINTEFVMSRTIVEI